MIGTINTQSSSVDHGSGIHAASLCFASAKACFAAKVSRYESRLSPSIKRRPRLLPGQVTTTLEINPVYQLVGDRSAKWHFVDL